MPLARRSTKSNSAKAVSRSNIKKSAAKSNKAAAALKKAKPAAKLSGNIQTKTELFMTIAEQCELSKKQVANVFDSIEQIINSQMKKGGAGSFTLPGLCKILVQEKPAVAARKGKNPFTGEMMMFKAKPKRRVIKIRALKRLKDMAAN